jgi:hypothetical protein
MFCFFIRPQLQCIARIYDIYEKDVTRYVEEQYPRILANSDNGGVHFSFISDRDAAGKERARYFLVTLLLFYFIFSAFKWLFRVAMRLRARERKTFSCFIYFNTNLYPRQYPPTPRTTCASIFSPCERLKILHYLHNIIAISDGEEF